MSDTKSAQELRKFGLTVGGALLVFGAIRSYFHLENFAVMLLGLGSVLSVFGLVFPTALGPVEKGWMRLAHVLAYINTRIILTVLFYLVFTPIGIIARLVKDPLNRKLHDGSMTYWIRREPKPADQSIYERQF
jgi:hypothetical protein